MKLFVILFLCIRHLDRKIESFCNLNLTYINQSQEEGKGMQFVAISEVS